MAIQAINEHLCINLDVITIVVSIREIPEFLYERAFDFGGELAWIRTMFDGEYSTPKEQSMTNFAWWNLFPVVVVTN